MPRRKTETPTIADIHASITSTKAPEPELWNSQKLRAAAAGAVFAACRPAFTQDDEDDLGFILSQLGAWVLYGDDYNGTSGPIRTDDLKREEASLRGAA